MANAEKQFPYRKVVVRIRVNPRWGERLQAAGIGFHVRTKEREAELSAKKVAQAEALGRDAFRGDRADATGTKQPDSGVPIFSWKPEGRQYVSLMLLSEDLATVGFILTGAHLMRKEGDQMFFLYLTFEEGKPLQLPIEVRVTLIGRLLARLNEHLHAFRNPDGSCTVNLSHALSEDAIPAGAAIRDLRLDAEGHFRCVPHE